MELHNILNEPMYVPPVNTNEVDLQLRDSDDSCFGRIEGLTFITGEEIYGDIRETTTVVKLDTLTLEHKTNVANLRWPLYMAYKAKSTIRIMLHNCNENWLQFKGFTVVAKGRPPPL